MTLIMKPVLSKGKRQYVFNLSWIVILLIGAYFLKSRYKAEVLPVLSSMPKVYYNDIIIGEDNAPLQVIMFHNYYSVGGRKFFDEAYSEMLEKYIKSGKIQFVIKLIEPGEHPDMMLALQTAICLNQFGVWDTFHDVIIFNPLAVHSEEFKKLIDEYISVNSDIAECILTNDMFDDVIRNNNDYYMLNTKVSPTFVVNNKLLQGYKGVDELFNVFDYELDNY